MKNWFRKEDGSVSVYFIIVLVPVFFFHAVLIDFVRIKAAEREAEHAVKAGARSVLSRFDAGLQQYGLFGRNADGIEMTGLFAGVVGHNLAPSKTGGFHYLDLRPAAGSEQVNSVYSLANQSILRSQILQEMKYRAPMEYTLEAVGKFKKSGQTAQLNAASQFSKKAEEIEKAIRKLNSALDDAWQEGLTLIRQSEEVQAQNTQTLDKINKLAEKIGLHTLDEVRSSITAIDENIRRISDSLSTMRDSLRNTESTLSGLAVTAKENADQIRSIEESVRSTEAGIFSLNGTLNELSQKKWEFEQLLNDIVAYLAAVQASKPVIEAAGTKLESGYAALTAKIGEAEQANRELIALKKKFADPGPDSEPKLNSGEAFGAIPVYGDDFFAIYKTNSGKIPAAMNAMKLKWMETFLFSGDNFTQLSEANGNLSAVTASFRTGQQIKEDERDSRNAGMDSKRKEHKLSLQKTINEVKSAMDGCGPSGGDDAYKVDYDKLTGNGNSNGLVQKYLDYQRSSAPGTDDPPYRPLDSDSTLKQAMDFPGKLGSLFQGMRDEFFVDEFALTKFSYRTLPSNNNELSVPERHPLNDQEAEFLLYGLSSCTANHMAAYGEMYVLFLAIRTAEALASPKSEWLNVGSPLLVLAASAAMGAKQAFDDMKRLTKGEEVPLSEKLGKITVNYKDLLRIFFLLHSRNELLLARIQGLLELNTGRDLTTQTVYIQANATVSVNLWFMPGVLKILQTTGLTGCTINDGRCELRKTAVMAY